MAEVALVSPPNMPEDDQPQEELQGVPAIVAQSLHGPESLAQDLRACAGLITQAPILKLAAMLQPSAQEVQADIMALQSSIQNTTQTAQVEKQGIDEELQRMQQLVRQFQDSMAQILQLGIHLG